MDQKQKKIFASLSGAALQMATPASGEKISAALEKGRKQRVSFEASSRPVSPINPRIRFR